MDRSNRFSVGQEAQHERAVGAMRRDDIPARRDMRVRTTLSVRSKQKKERREL